MDLLLLDSNARLARLVANSLAPTGPRLVHAAGAPLAAGAFWPHSTLTRAILLGFDLPSLACMRVLHRLWIADDGPPSYLVTTPGSSGERVLAALVGSASASVDWATRPQAVYRPAKSLSIERLMSLGRLVAPTAAEAGAGSVSPNSGHVERPHERR